MEEEGEGERGGPTVRRKRERGGPTVWRKGERGGATMRRKRERGLHLLAVIRSSRGDC